MGKKCKSRAVLCKFRNFIIFAKIFTNQTNMNINNIGENAGKIWTVLNKNGKMTETKLKKETELASADFYAAMGWLAREGKVQVECTERCGKTCEYITLA